MQLPIQKYRETILSAVAQNKVVVVIGEAGSGKTTQIPQILVEAGYGELGMIGVTQPRRVAAISAARRVSSEMNSVLGVKVGYSVRFEEKSSRSTVIKYLTDGTLLRECLADSKFEKYSVLMLDEAHERSLNTDVLFGVVRNIVQQRSDLKVLITSATLDSAKFSQYFNDCPVIDVEGTCFPVKIVHSRENHLQNYVQAAVDVVIDIHCNKPEGDILLFLTGQAEICKTVDQINKAIQEQPAGSCGPLQVLPLYAALPLQKQNLVFSPPPEGCRRCVVATNVAETSITVDGIVYVVDPGTVKQKIYDSHSGMDSLRVVSISHVQAKQRAGRAGRTREGVCFRLYSKEFYEKEMNEASLPEIKRTSLVSTVLYLKSLEMDIDVLSFEFLDKPDSAQLEDALKQLFILDAIDEDGHITALGKRMASFPLDPSLSRALIAAADQECEAELLKIASMLSVDNVFLDSKAIRKVKEDESNQLICRIVREGHGDHFALLKIYDHWTLNNCSREWCGQQGLDYKSMKTARDIHQQLTHVLDGYASEFDSEDEDQVSKMEQRRRERGRFKHMTDREKHRHYQRKFVKLEKVLAVGFANRIAHRMVMHNGYRPLNPNAHLCELHPSCSVLKPDDDGLLPEWIIYHEIIDSSRPFLSKVCPVSGHLVEKTLDKLKRVDVHRLSSGRFRVPDVNEVPASEDASRNLTAKSNLPSKRKHCGKSLEAARQRFLKRKQMRL